MEMNRKAEAVKVSKVFQDDEPAGSVVLNDFLSLFSDVLYNLKDSSNRLTSAVLRLDSDAFNEDICCEVKELQSKYRGAIPRLDQQLTELSDLKNTINATLNKLEKYI